MSAPRIVTPLHLTGVDVTVGNARLLSEVNLDTDARSIAVVGENGSGKTTFARLLGGLVGRSAGLMSVAGVDPTKSPTELRRRVAMVFSNPDTQIVMPTVADDIAFSLRSLRLPRAEADARVAATLERFGLSSLARSSAHALSGGQKQLVAVAGALVRNPSLLIADEPTSYLDARNARVVANHLLAAGGPQVVIVTHDLELARRCDTTLLFANGRLVQVGDAETVVRAYEDRLQC